MSREPFDDRSEPDEHGMYDFIYSGFYYTFQDGQSELVFAVYSDNPHIASLKRPMEWSPVVYASCLFNEAVKYLRENESIDVIEICDPTPPGRGFIPFVEAVRLARAAGLQVPEEPQDP